MVPQKFLLNQEAYKEFKWITEMNMGQENVVVNVVIGRRNEAVATDGTLFLCKYEYYLSNKLPLHDK